MTDEKAGLRERLAARSFDELDIVEIEMETAAWLRDEALSYEAERARDRARPDGGDKHYALSMWDRAQACRDLADTLDPKETDQ